MDEQRVQWYAERWLGSRVRRICENYEAEYGLFSSPSHDKTTGLLGFAREIAESIGYASSGGDAGGDDGA